MSTRAKWVFVALVLLVGAACGDSLVRDTGVVSSSEQLQELVNANLEDRPNILGTIVRVDIEGGGSYQAASGFVDSSHTTPINPDTPFIIGSITKMFTAALIYQLIEEKQVRPDDPIIELLSPNWADALAEVEHGDEMTVEHVLSHRSGIVQVTNSEEFRNSVYFDSTAYKPLDIVKMAAGTGETAFRPGENYEYNNVNYILLGGLIEHVSGFSYRDALQHNILDKIGLEETSLVGRTYAPLWETIARGYSTVDGELRDGRDVPVEWAHAAGGIVSTTGDLVRFQRALVSGDLFADGTTYGRMCERVGHNESYGRGVEIFDDPETGPCFGHKGNFIGTRSILAYFPEDRMTVVIVHTYVDFSMAHPSDLLKRVVQGVRGTADSGRGGLELEGPDILDDTSGAVASEDVPARGTWDFAPQEEWVLDRLHDRPLGRQSTFRVDDDGSVVLLDSMRAEISMLDPKGRLLRSFGGHGDGPRFQYPVDLFISTNSIHVLDMGAKGDRIKTYDKTGGFIGAADVERGMSPRLFVDDERYLAVHSGPDPLNRPANELLEIISLAGDERVVLARFPAEDPLIMECMVPMGRYILLENNINIFPRLIVHFGEGQLHVGRSDRYLIKKISVGGGETLAFSVSGREREMLPPHFAEELADRKPVAGQPMADDIKQRFIAGFPARQVVFTQIDSDDRGFVYVIAPDIAKPGRKKVDIFSPEGVYLYRAVVELPEAVRRILQLDIERGHLYALFEREDDTTHLVKYEIQQPASG